MVARRAVLVQKRDRAIRPGERSEAGYRKGVSQRPHEHMHARRLDGWC
jgi:hypothetical protein